MSGKHVPLPSCPSFKAHAEALAGRRWLEAAVVLSALFLHEFWGSMTETRSRCGRALHAGHALSGAWLVCRTPEKLCRRRI